VSRLAKRLQSALPTFTTWWHKVREFLGYYLGGLYHRTGQRHFYLMAGGLAFSLFVCAVPLVLVVFAVVSNFFDRPAVAGEIAAFIDRAVPYPEYAASVKQFIAERLEQTAQLQGTAGIIGVIGLLFASTGLFSSLRTILDAVFSASRPAPAVLGKLWDFAMIVIVLVLFVILVLTLPAIETTVELAKRTELLQEVDVHLGRGTIWLAISFVSLVVTYAAIYWLVPLRKPGVRTILVSGVSASVLWLLAKEVFGYYIGHMATIRHIYGVYTFMIVAAFWVYYSALVLIVSAEIGQLYAERRRATKRAKT
jgi:membrane protein